MAEVLADAYIRKGQELYFPLPTDFGATSQEMRDTAVQDFLGFIREWRRRAEMAGCFKRDETELSSISTWDLLPSLGFVPDPDVLSDRPGLSYQFGNVKVSASYVFNLRLKEIVLFTGVLIGEN